MSQESLNPEIRFLGQKMCSVARERMDGRMDTQTHTEVTTVGTLSGFQEFLQPIIKDRPNESQISNTKICSSSLALK